MLRLEGEWYMVAGEGLWRWRALGDEAGAGTRDGKNRDGAL